VAGEGRKADAVGKPKVTVEIDGKAVQIGLRTAEMIRQLVEHQAEFEGAAVQHGDVVFRLQMDRVKMGITRVLPSRRLMA